VIRILCIQVSEFVLRSREASAFTQLAETTSVQAQWTLAGCRRLRNGAGLALAWGILEFEPRNLSL